MKPVKPQPYKCPVCSEKPETYYERLCFPDELGPDVEPPTCPCHKDADGNDVVVVELVPCR